MHGAHRILHTVDGRTLFARVEVEVVPGDQATEIRVSDANNAQNALWRTAAVAGVRFALRDAGRTAHVVVQSIDATVVDTTTIAVAVAACRAVWAALGFVATATSEEALELALAASRAEPDALLAPFDAAEAGV